MSTFLESFINIVKEKSNNIALESSISKLTYNELYKEISKRSSLLKNIGIIPNEIVAVICDDKIENIINCISVIMVGGVFLAVDEEIPKERLKLIIEDSSIKHVIHNKKIMWSNDVCKIDFDDFPIMQLDEFTPIYSENMYMLYTSGTTGIPKAVVIHHNAFMVFRNGINKTVEYDKRKVIFLASTSLTFDISILETLVTLSYGGRVICVDDTQKMSPQYIKEVIEKLEVNTVQFTPTYMLFLMKHFNNDLSFMKNVKKILIGGEVFNEEIRQCLNYLNNGELFNCYGPTEATIWATIERVELTGDISIGYPMDGYDVYVDCKQNDGIGEICIKGEAVAFGYFQRPQLTEERFKIVDGERMYKTGDLGRQLDDGRIIFCGRKDRQVKIKGFRVELDEIESRISKIYSEIYKVAVIFKGKDLVCFYQLDKKIPRKEFIKKLKQYLPTYMIPMYYKKIDVVPVLINGKIDYKHLSEMFTRGVK